LSKASVVKYRVNAKLTFVVETTATEGTGRASRGPERTRTSLAASPKITVACCGRRAFASLRRTSPAPTGSMRGRHLQRIHASSPVPGRLRQSCPDFIAAGFHDDATRDGFWKYCQASKQTPTATTSPRTTSSSPSWPSVCPRPTSAPSAPFLLYTQSQKTAQLLSASCSELTQQLVPSPGRTRGRR